MHLAEFIHQKSYEKIEKLVRRSAITFIPYLLLAAVLIAIPFVLYTFAETLFPNLFMSPITNALAILVGSGFLVAALLFLYTNFVTFYLDLLIITNDRLLDIEQKTLFARSVSETDLFTIQDVSSDVTGIFASLFNYGNLTIQTAAATEKFLIPNVPDPNGLRHLILDLCEEDRKHHNPYIINPRPVSGHQIVPPAA